MVLWRFAPPPDWWYVGVNRYSQPIMSVTGSVESQHGAHDRLTAEGSGYGREFRLRSPATTS